MKAKLIGGIVVAIVLGLATGGYFYYDKVLRLSDDFTDCPLKEFKFLATDSASADAFVTEQSMVSMKITERCGLDCDLGNIDACVLFGIAKNKGVHTVKDPEGSEKILRKACDKGRALACDLMAHALEQAREEKKRAAVDAAKEAQKEVLISIQKRRGEVVRTVDAALSYFKGKSAPMTSKQMIKWYNDTVQHLLFGTPILSQMHQIPGSRIEKSGLADFVTAKYLGNGQTPDFEPMNEVFEKFMRLGVQQIRLDYRVEKKKETEIPNSSGYFRAKHTFLYNAAKTELQLLDVVQNEITASINGSE